MSPFLDELDLHGAHAALDGRVAELEAFLEVEKKGSHEV